MKVELTEAEKNAVENIIEKCYMAAGKSALSEEQDFDMQYELKKIVAALEMIKNGVKNDGV